MQWQGIIGIVVLLLVCWGISENRKVINWRLVLAALAMQLVLAVLLLKFEFFQSALIGLNQIVLVLERATQAGTEMVFGYLGGGELPFKESYPGASFILAFRALPLVMVMGALSSLLFYWRILPLIIRGFSWALEKSLGVSGPVGMGAAANIFLGMVESPLLIKPYIASMNRNQLFMVMSCGMATVAGTVMVLYATILGSSIEGALGHIIVASILSAPAALLFAEMLVPREGVELEVKGVIVSESHSSMEAITQGTQDGLKLYLNIIAMLIVMVAFVSMVNQFLSFLPAVMGEPISLNRILGVIFAPVMWLVGIPWEEASTAGALMGTKVVLNEFLAFIHLSQIGEEAFSDRSRLITVYALCGFANLGSLGIMVGGLTALVPEKRLEIISLGMKTILSGVLATLMTGAWVGLVIG